MRRALDIGHTSARLFLRNKTAYVWLFLMPIGFMYFMGFANRGPGSPSNRVPTVRVENLDLQALGRVFLDELGAQGLRILPPTEGNPADRSLRIPQDFTARIVQRQPARIQFLHREGSDAGDAALVELRVWRALIAINAHLVELVGVRGESAVTNEMRFREVMGSPDPVRLEARFAGRKPVPSGFNFSVPGNLVMYVLMNLVVFGGAGVAAERRSGVLKRLSVHPLRPGELVAGQLYGLILLGLVQILVFLVAGRFLFGVKLGGNVPVLGLVLVVFAWDAAALGVLAGSVMAREDRVVGVCVLTSLLMAALGGCWWPLEVAPRTLQVAAQALPTGWALSALHQLISFGNGFAEVRAPLAALVVFGAVTTWLAGRYFRV